MSQLVSIAKRVRALAGATMAKAVNVRFGRDEKFYELASWLHSEHRHMKGPDFEMPSLSTVEAELMFAATNYCFWSGRADVLPAGGGATLLRKIILDVRINALSFENAVERACEAVVEAGFPLANERVGHLRELLESPTVPALIQDVVGKDGSPEDVAEIACTYFRGFADDPFKKRALLLAHVFHRCYGRFAGKIDTLPVAVDYQLPKMLRHAGVIEYSPALTRIVDAQVHLPSHGEMENEIRSVTLLACERLARESRVSESSIDCLLWLTRQSVTTPFHLTVTTDY